MSDAIFVLNAGSSSLKFSVYGLVDQDLSVGARGETEVVHGGLTFSEPTLIDAAVMTTLEQAHSAGAAAPTAQPEDHQSGGHRPLAGGARPLAHARAGWRATVDTSLRVLPTASSPSIHKSLRAGGLRDESPQRTSLARSLL